MLAERSDEEVRLDLLEKLGQFRAEVEEVLSAIVLPNWDDELHGRTHLLYGSMMMCFAYVDLFSALWRGDVNTSGQSKRMVDFIGRYLRYDGEAAEVAVTIWRHKLMHTARPRALEIEGSGKRYYWLLQWGEPHLDRDDHFRFTETADMRVLGIGLTFLIEDLRKGVRVYFEELDDSPELEENFTRARQNIEKNSYYPL